MQTFQYYNFGMELCTQYLFLYLNIKPKNVVHSQKLWGWGRMQALVAFTDPTNLLEIKSHQKF